MGSSKTGIIHTFCTFYCYTEFRIAEFSTGYRSKPLFILSSEVLGSLDKYRKEKLDIRIVLNWKTQIVLIEAFLCLSLLRGHTSHTDKLER